MFVFFYVKLELLYTKKYFYATSKLGNEYLPTWKRIAQVFLHMEWIQKLLKMIDAKTL